MFARSEAIFPVSYNFQLEIWGQGPFWCCYDSINYQINCLKHEIEPSIMKQKPVFLWGSKAVQVASVCLNTCTVSLEPQSDSANSIINCSLLASWIALHLPMSIQLAGNFIHRKRISAWVISRILMLLHLTGTHAVVILGPLEKNMLIITIRTQLQGVFMCSNVYRCLFDFWIFLKFRNFSLKRDNSGV